MKKVLSVAMASAMVLGMGANAFAITYNTGSNDTAAWPSNFKFDGALFVTNKDGDIITEATTAINDNEAVDFEPGDVIWMPLYANNQYQYSADYSKGTSEKAEVNNIKLGADYFDEKETTQLPSIGEDKEIKENLGVIRVVSDKPLANTPTKITVTVGKVNVTGKVNANNSGVIFQLSKSDYETATGKTAPDGYTAVDVETKPTLTATNNADEVAGTDATLTDVKVATYRVNAVNGAFGKFAQLNGIPTTIDVVSGSTTTTRTVASAKAVVNGKTFTATNKGNNFTDLKNDVNKELEAMFKAGKSAQIKDVVVTVNLAKEEGTSDFIGKPVIVEGDKIEVVDGKVDALLADYGHYTGNIDKNWSINLIEKSTGVAELIEKAELYKATARDYASYEKYTDEIMPNAVYLKVTLKKEWKTTSSETLKYYVYVADNKSNKNKTNEVWVSGKYANTDVRVVDFTWTNDASKAGLWKAEENGTAVFDFADKVFFTVKMYKGETMYLDLSTAYDKLVAGEMDVDADSFYKFDNTNASFIREGELVIVSDDDTLVPYEIDEDGNFVELDAEYVTDYKIAHTNAKVNGFAFNTKQLGNYVLSTDVLGEDEEPVDEEPVDEEPVDEEPVDEEPAAEVEAPKANPETGAADYVGLAVSLAVVSVAAAGALALKK